MSKSKDVELRNLLAAYKIPARDSPSISRIFKELQNARNKQSYWARKADRANTILYEDLYHYGTPPQPPETPKLTRRDPVFELLQLSKPNSPSESSLSSDHELESLAHHVAAGGQEAGQ